MDRDEELVSIGATPVLSDNNGNAPDMYYIPSTSPQRRTRKWPSGIVETTYSESAAKSRADIKWWLLASDGDVRVALSVHVSPRRLWIVVEHWNQN